jgi:hypothetical protein
MKQRKEVTDRFEGIFKIPYEEGISRLKRLLKRSISFESFGSVGYSKISMNERDFGIFAFFACLGANHLEELGIPALPAHGLVEDESEIIEAEFEEVVS